MVTQRKFSAYLPQQRGSTTYGVLAGLLVGLVIAAIVAFFVTKAPMPFVDRASRDSGRTQQTDPRMAPDPNLGLYGRDGAAGTPPGGPTATAPTPLPNLSQGAQTPGAAGTQNQQPDELGALIATLPYTGERTATRTPTPAAPPASARPTTPAAPATPPSAASGKYFLQAGAYQAAADADGVKARILLLGLPVAVQRAEVNGKQINRVRVGPFARLDDMNRARSLLGENKIETAVVRQ